MADDYLVLVVDPQSAEVDAHGPLDVAAAGRKAIELRADLDRSPELGDVQVLIVPLQRPAGRL